MKAEVCYVCSPGPTGACVCDRIVEYRTVALVVRDDGCIAMHGWPLWTLGHNLAVAGALADGPAKMERVLREAGGNVLIVARVAPMAQTLSTLHGVAIRLLEPGHPTVRDIWRAKHWAEWMEAWANDAGRASGEERR